MVTLSTKNVQELVDFFSGFRITNAYFDEKKDYDAWETKKLCREGETFDNVLIEITRLGDRMFLLTITTTVEDIIKERNWHIIISKISTKDDFQFSSAFVPLEDLYAPEDKGDKGNKDDKKQT